MAGLPQGGETPLGRDLFCCKYLHPLSFSCKYIQSIVCCKVYHSFQNHHVNRAPVVETCRENIIANLLSNCPSFSAEVRETE